MSNFLAIATVTAALRRALQSAVGADVPGALVTTNRPEAPKNDAQQTGVNIYLYQVTANPAWRNADLPTRRMDGSLAKRPQAALNAHYLFTFYGDEGSLEPQRLLGSVVRTLHARPVLTRSMIQNTIVDPAFDFLAGSNLAEAVERVKFTPASLSLEELSKLWSVFFQLPYALSVAYEASVILIESDDAPQTALPVRQRNLHVVPFRQPVIDEVISQAGKDQPIVAGSTLHLVGRRLRGDNTRIRIGESEVTPQAVSDDRITLELPSLPAGVLRAGVQGLQVVHPLLMGSPPTAHGGAESNVAAFVLRPTITELDASSREVTVKVDPMVGRAQRVVLMLNELSINAPAAYTFVAGLRAADASSITIPISGVKAGEYLVRLQVDGAESLLSVDADSAGPAFTHYTGPKVTIP